MIILGLDIATTTGFAWYEPGSSLASIKTGLIKAEGDNAEQKAASLARLLIEELHDWVNEERTDDDGRKRVVRVRRRKPVDFVAIEEPMRNVMRFEKVTHDLVDGEIPETTINPNQMLLHTLVGAAVAIMAGYGIPFQTIPSQTWRKAYFGSGFKPPLKWIKKDRHKGGGYWEKQWKKAAVERAGSLRISVKNADAAEAIGVAFAAANCQRFKSLTAPAEPSRAAA